MESDHPSRATAIQWTGPNSALIACALIGFVARMILVVASPGSLDVSIWQGHAEEIDRQGLIAYYHGGRFIFNHPPLAGYAITGLWHLSGGDGAIFATLLRAPFALLDAGTAWLLIQLAGHAQSEQIRRRRFVVGAAYWVCPLSIVFSSQHGNTDSAISFFLVATVLAVAKRRAALAGALLGLSLWIKIPGILAVPALLFVLPGWKDRRDFLGFLAATGLVGFLPTLLQDPRAVIDAVFLYSGLRIQTTTGTQIWGPQVFYPDPGSLELSARRLFVQGANLYYRANSVVTIGPIILFAWLRRNQRAPEQVAQTIATSYVILYGLTNFFAFQYLAWALPFWFLSGWPLAIIGSLLASAYVWGLYGWLCEHWFLLDTWRFATKPNWPSWIIWLRNLNVIFFFGLACTALASALGTEWNRWRAKQPLR
jgi:hypothetical protein